MFRFAKKLIVCKKHSRQKKYSLEQSILCLNINSCLNYESFTEIKRSFSDIISLWSWKLPYQIIFETGLRIVAKFRL